MHLLLSSVFDELCGHRSLTRKGVWVRVKVAGIQGVGLRFKVAGVKGVGVKVQGVGLSEDTAH